MSKLWSIVYVRRFPIDDKEKTVREYFQEAHNIKLMYPHLPCLHVGQKTKNVYVPLEVTKYCDNLFVETF